MLRKLKTILVLFATIMLGAKPAFAQDITALGGDTTSFDHNPKVTIQLPTPNISSGELFNYHLNGFIQFHKDFTNVKLNSKHILGPNFNHNACGGCHDQNGKGQLGFPKLANGSQMLVKVSVPGLNPDGSAKKVPKIGEQLRDHTIKGQSKFNIKLKSIYKKGKYPDGTPYKLRRFKVTFDIPGYSKKKKKKLLTSLRMSPPMVGLGLLEAVAPETILALSDPNDLNGDGISGHPNYVPNIRNQTFEIGKFGFKANHPTLEQQSAAAFFNDMGLTNELFNLPGKQQEIDTEVLKNLTFYLQAAGVPPARDQSDPDVIAGKQLFQDVNCHACHTMTLTTGDSAIAEVANQTFHPFTDLLLHDMGPGLADNRPDLSASGSEWRTTPLWAIGLTGVFNNNNPGYLHDGRGRTLEEAILWHDGEAKNSRLAFMNLEKAKRNQLIRFLKSL